MFIQRIKDGKRDQYIKDHEECWPELVDAIRKSGIKRNIIWLYGNEILNYTMAKDFNKSMNELSGKMVFKNWIKRMKPLLEVMQDFSGEGNVIKLEKVFDLEEQIKSVE